MRAFRIFRNKFFLFSIHLGGAGRQRRLIEWSARAAPSLSMHILARRRNAVWPDFCSANALDAASLHTIASATSDKILLHITAFSLLLPFTSITSIAVSFGADGDEKCGALSQNGTSERFECSFCDRRIGCYQHEWTEKRKTSAKKLFSFQENDTAICLLRSPDLLILDKQKRRQFMEIVRCQ